MRQVLIPIFFITVTSGISIVADDAMTTTTSSPEPSKAITVLTSGKLIALKQRSLFGESCNKTLKCKSRSWLSCDNSASKCQCTKPDDMIWNSQSSKCVGTIGGSCRFVIAGPEGDGHQLYEIAGCVENSFCDLDKDGGTCRCRQTFYGNQEGTKCFPKKDHGSQCNSSMECNQMKRLNCNDNSTCVCEDPLNMLVDPNDGSCKVKIGTDCSLFRNGCFSNATCVASNADKLLKCTCPEGHYATVGGIGCLQMNKKGSPCSRDVECDAKDRLACVNNNCSCDPRISIENVEKIYTTMTTKRGILGLSNINGHFVPVGTCLSKVGHNCTVRRLYDWGSYATYSDERYCIPNALCNDLTALCQCSQGTAKTRHNMCGKTHGSPCSESNPCTDNLICDLHQASLLAGHYTRTCKCPNPHQQLYDSDSQECRGKPGASCIPGKPTSCIPDASCSQSKRLRSRYTCECNSGFVERQSSGECNIEYGHECTLGPPSPSALQCDQEAGLHCILNFNGTATCLCPDAEDVYEPLRRRCSRPVGLSCLKTEDCITNSYCDTAKGRIGRRCVCNNGSEELDNGGCSRIEVMLTDRNVNASGFDINNNA